MVGTEPAGGDDSVRSYEHDRTPGLFVQILALRMNSRPSNLATIPSDTLQSDPCPRHTW